MADSSDHNYRNSPDSSSTPEPESKDAPERLPKPPEPKSLPEVPPTSDVWGQRIRTLYDSTGRAFSLRETLDARGRVIVTSTDLSQSMWAYDGAGRLVRRIDQQGTSAEDRW